MRPAIVLPLQVTTGTPAHNASLAVAALNGSVSRNTSASRWRERCSARGAGAANTSRAGSMPRAAASLRSRSQASSLPRDSHSTLPALRDNSRIHTSNIGRAILQFRRQLGLLVDWLVAFRQMHDLLGDQLLLIERQYRPVGDDVIDELSPHGRGITEIHLDGCWPGGEDAGAAILDIAVDIDGYVDLQFAQQPGRSRVRPRGDVVKSVERARKRSAKVPLDGAAERHADDVELGSVVARGQRRDRPGAAEVVGGDIGQADLVVTAVRGAGRPGRYAHLVAH